MNFAIVRSTVTGQWSYCPEAALPFFRQTMEYDETPTGLLTWQDAVNSAKSDKSIPKRAKFTVIEPNPIQGAI